MAAPAAQRPIRLMFDAPFDLDTVETGIARKLSPLDALSAARLQRSRSGGGAASPTGLRLLAQGDSWLDHRPTDLADRLRREGGHAGTSLTISGSTLDQVGYGVLPRDHLGATGANQISLAEGLIYAMQPVRPHALLLSAGGNDVKGGALSLLGPALASPAGIDTSAVRR